MVPGLACHVCMADARMFVHAAVQSRALRRALMCCTAAVQVGLWAQKHLPHMDVPALRAFGEVLEIDNPDLFKWLTGQAPAEESVARNPSFQV